MDEKMKKIRKIGWIVTGILGAITIAMLVAYIVTDGTYGLPEDVSSAISAKVCEILHRA